VECKGYIPTEGFNFYATLAAMTGGKHLKEDDLPSIVETIVEMCHPPTKDVKVIEIYNVVSNLIQHLRINVLKVLSCIYCS